MVRVKMMGTGGVALIDNTRVQLFDKFGICDNQDYGIIPRFTQGMQNLPILSILSSGGTTELALFNEDDTMEKKILTKDVIEVVGLLQGRRDFVKVLQRGGKEKGIRYNQYILIYPKGTNLRDKINYLM